MPARSSSGRSPMISPAQLLVFYDHFSVEFLYERGRLGHYHQNPLLRQQMGLHDAKERKFLINMRDRDNF